MQLGSVGLAVDARMVLGTVAHCQGAAPDRRATNSPGTSAADHNTPLCQVLRLVSIPYKLFSIATGRNPVLII